MRRMMSLGTAVLISLSLSACTARNAPIKNNTGQNIGSEQGLNNVNGNVGSNLGAYRSYKDGTYTAQGDKNIYGNQTAAVIIKNGRINNIILGMVDNTGRSTAYPSLTNNAIGTNDNNLTNNTVVNYNNTNNGLTPETTAPQANKANLGYTKWYNQDGTLGGTYSGTAGNAAAYRNWGITGGAMNSTTNPAPKNSTNANTSNTTTGSSKWYEAARNIVFATGGVRGGGRVVDHKSNANNSNTSNIGNNTSLAPGMAGNTNTSIVKAPTLNLDSLKINLVNAMIQNQTFNVTIPTSNPEYNTIISNWKLAVQRALEKSLR